MNKLWLKKHRVMTSYDKQKPFLCNSDPCRAVNRYRVTFSWTDSDVTKTLDRSNLFGGAFFNGETKILQSSYREDMEYHNHFTRGIFPDFSYFGTSYGYAAASIEWSPFYCGIQNQSVAAPYYAPAPVMKFFDFPLNFFLVDLRYGGECCRIWINGAIWQHDGTNLTLISFPDVVGLRFLNIAQLLFDGVPYYPLSNPSAPEPPPFYQGPYWLDNGSGRAWWPRDVEIFTTFGHHLKFEKFGLYRVGAGDNHYCEDFGA